MVVHPGRAGRGAERHRDLLVVAPLLRPAGGRPPAGDAAAWPGRRAPAAPLRPRRGPLAGSARSGRSRSSSESIWRPFRLRNSSRSRLPPIVNSQLRNEASPRQPVESLETPGRRSPEPGRPRRSRRPRWRRGSGRPARRDGAPARLPPARSPRRYAATSAASVGTSDVGRTVIQPGWTAVGRVR